MNWLQKTSIQFNNRPYIDPKEKKKWEIMGLVRAHLEGTDRFSTKDVFYYAINDVIPVEMSEFSLIIDELAARGFLEKFNHNEGEAFRWTKNPIEFPGNLPL